MRAYIAGKISGLPLESARAKFSKYADCFRSIGFDVVNPMELPHNHPDVWEDYMAEDILAMLTCNVLVLLPCWQDSPGARLEYAIARAAGLRVIKTRPNV